MITFTEAFILQEVFDPKNVNYEWEFDHIATFDVPTKEGKKGYAIYFTDKDDAVDISFAPEKPKDVSHEDYEPFERTGAGGTGAVLANVMAATMDYIKKNKPDKLTMHAADEGLGKLYKRMLKRYLPRSQVEQERRNLIVHLAPQKENDEELEEGRVRDVLAGAALSLSLLSTSGGGPLTFPPDKVMKTQAVPGVPKGQARPLAFVEKLPKYEILKGSPIHELIQALSNAGSPDVEGLKKLVSYANNPDVSPQDREYAQALLNQYRKALLNYTRKFDPVMKYPQTGKRLKK